MSGNVAGRDHKPRQGRTVTVGSRRLRATHGVVGGLALLAISSGVLLLVLASGIVASVLGAALLGLAGIALVSLAFLVVGEGEDDDRLRNPHG
jgi:hypothetical protein